MAFVLWVIWTLLIIGCWRRFQYWGSAFKGGDSYRVLTGSKNGPNSNSWPAVTVTLTAQGMVVRPTRRRWPRLRFPPTYALPREECGRLRVRRRALASWLFLVEGPRAIAIVPPRWANFAEAWEALGWPALEIDTTKPRALLDRLFPSLAR